MSRLHNETMKVGVEYDTLNSLYHQAEQLRLRYSYVSEDLMCALRDNKEHALDMLEHIHYLAYIRLHAEQKEIERIKIFRDIFNLSLTESKEAIDILFSKSN